MCILLSDCTNTVVIRLKNKSSDCRFYKPPSVAFQKTESLGGRRERLVHEAGHVNY